MITPVSIEKGHYQFSIGLNRDFVAYNVGYFKMTEEEIVEEDLRKIELKNVPDKVQQIKSEAWSSNCKWIFVFQDDGIYLLNVYDSIVWHCRKHSVRFIEMYLNTPIK